MSRLAAPRLSTIAEMAIDEALAEVGDAVDREPMSTRRVLTHVFRLGGNLGDVEQLIEVGAVVRYADEIWASSFAWRVGR